MMIKVNKNIEKKIRRIFKDNYIDDIYAYDKEPNLFITFSDTRGINFDMLSKLAELLGTKNINIMEDPSSYTPDEFYGVSSTITIICNDPKKSIFEK